MLKASVHVVKAFPAAQALLIGALSACSSLHYAAEVDEAFFEKRIRPLLINECYKCHSHEEEKNKGGLFVDSRAGLLSGGDTGPAINVGNAAQSLLITAVNYDDPDLEMPPKSKLTPQQVADLTVWINSGAPWPKEAAPANKSTAHREGPTARDPIIHWAWEEVKNTTPPAVASHKDWVQSPIDQFILDGLLKNKLAPAPKAPRAALIRRASFTLTGLPPSVDEINEFLADKKPTAFASMIDRYLASPKFGEHWARHWLDLVRYGESRGHEFDADATNAYQYRDYVIRAFNADVPYDVFTQEQIAGDLLPKPRENPADKSNESILGTGFWYLGEMVHSPVEIFQDEGDRIDNQIDVMGKTFMGLTVGCARCHDHKFDPITAKDYYALGGFVRSSHYSLVRFDTQKHNSEIAKKIWSIQDKAQPTLVAAIQKGLGKESQNIADYINACFTIDEQAGVTVEEIANKAKLNPDRIKAWHKHLEHASKDLNDPLRLLGRLLAVPANTRDATLAKFADEEQQRITAAIKTYHDEIAVSTTLVDYRNAEESWYSDNALLGKGPKATGDVLIVGSAQSPALAVADRAAAYVDPLWDDRTTDAASGHDASALGYNRAGRTLRTRTFTLGEGSVYVLMRGYGSIYSSIGNHIIIQGPLHGSLVQRLLPKNDKKKGKDDKGDEVDDISSDWRWVELRLSDYAGQLVHFEFTPEDDYFAVAQVIQGKRPPPPPPILPPTSAKSLAELAKQNQIWFTSALSTWSKQGKQSPPHVAMLVSYAVAHSELFGEPEQSALAALAEQQNKLAAEIKKSSRLAMAMQDGEGADWNILIRGVAKNKGAVAPRALPESLFGSNQPAITNGSGRLELAQRITSDKNPLFSRVMVNRLWHYLMGRGLVSSVDNFGALGERPTHPELLDWLATRFAKDGWSTKQMIRTIMLSSTWQMDSIGKPAFEELDPNNLYWHHAQVRRLSGEMIRDSLLLLAGNLKDIMYGKPVPTYLSEFMQGRGRPKSGPLDGDGRRSIYLSVRRNFLSPMMLAFDTPIPFNTMGRRSNSNVPAQALTMLNDPLIAQQSDSWVKRALADSTLSIDQRINRLFIEAFARPPFPSESTTAHAFLGDKPDAATWGAFGHALVNVKEFIFLR